MITKNVWWGITLPSEKQKHRSGISITTLNREHTRKPNPLGIFNVGAENFGANTVTIELAKPVFELTFSIMGEPAEKRGAGQFFFFQCS